MNRNLLSAIALLAFSASPLFASVGVDAGDKMNIQVIDWDVTNLSGGGGPFQLTFTEKAADGGGSIGVFNGFCVEYSQHFNDNSTYTISAVTDVGSTTPRTLTGYAAWAFNKFLDIEATAGGGAALRSHLQGLTNITASSDLLARQVAGIQKAIWAGMYGTSDLTKIAGSTDANSEAGFIDTTGSDADQYIKDAGVTWDDFVAPSNNSWGGNTVALKQAYTGGFKVVQIGGNQDQLFIAGGGFQPSPPAVPEPASLVIWSLIAGGAAGLGVVRRRRPLARGRWTDSSRNAILAVIECRTAE